MKIANNSFIKSSVTLISGSLLAQILAVAISPVITRVYTEEQIGEYTLILTAVAMFGPIICGRYDASIVTDNEEKNVWALIKLSFFITFVGSILIGLGYSIYYEYFNEPTLSFLSVFIWVCVLLILSGVGHILSSYNNRKKEYKLLSKITVIREIGRDVSLTGLGFLGIGTLGLLISQVFSVTLGFSRQAKSLWPYWKNIIQCPFEDVRRSAQKHINQFVYSVPASFANSFSYSSLNLFVSSLFGLEALAYYSMSFRMLGLPLTLLGMNVSKVFFEKAAREFDLQRNFRKTFVQTAIMLGGIAVVMVLFLMAFAPTLFAFFFGDSWYESGIYVRYLAPMFGIRLVVSALTPTMIICGKQKNELIIQILFGLMAIVAYMICQCYEFNINAFLLCVSVLYSTVYIIYFLYMYIISKK